MMMQVRAAALAIAIELGWGRGASASVSWRDNCRGRSPTPKPILAAAVLWLPTIPSRFGCRTGASRMPTIPAEPYPFELRLGCSALLIIDMQRDFLEPGGFGASLGNDVGRLRRAIEPTRLSARPCASTRRGAAMLGALAGIAIAFISMRPAFLSWEVPWLAFVSPAIILISWTAGVRLPGGVPGGLAAVLSGTALGWIATFTGISSVMDPHAAAGALSKFGLHPAHPLRRFGARAGRYRAAACRGGAARHLQFH
jgi:hypothetical protein